jgi:hypothetical protein
MVASGADRGNCAAPRGALLYPQFSWEELGGRFLGLMAYLDPKGEGDQSMPGKQWPCPGVRARGAAGPAEYGESWIASSPISRRCKPPSTGKTPEPVPCRALVFRFHRRNLRGTGRCPSEGIQGDEWATTFRSTRTTRTNAGSPTGRESHGDGGLVVVAGVAPRQGVRESRKQGEGGQVIGHHNPGGMRNAERRNGTGCPVVTGEPVAGKSGTAGSDRWSLEKDLPNRNLASDLPVRRNWVCRSGAAEARWRCG